MKTNTTPRFKEKTHQGAPAARLNDRQLLRRSVLSCLLWENEFYEDGTNIVKRIMSLSLNVPVKELLELALEARKTHHLRHVPLLLLCLAVRRAKEAHIENVSIADYTFEVIQRADEITELVALYRTLNERGEKEKLRLPAQFKIGLAMAFNRFDAYQLGKYNRDGAVKLKDVLRMVHPKPLTPQRAEVFGKIIAGTLESPDTWEVQLSGGADKKELFTRLINERKLGYLALLRNLRNMAQAGVDRGLIEDAIEARHGAERVLPFRYIAAARAEPSFEPSIDRALLACIGDMDPFMGRTLILVDVSDSMNKKLSGKSDLTRMDAAATLASIWPGRAVTQTFSAALITVPPRRGMAGVDAIIRSQPHGGTWLGRALRQATESEEYDRLVVITDEQSHDAVHRPSNIKHCYMINVASDKNGVGYGDWVRINGFSEAVISFIRNHEA